jgi:hypothetical protein
VTTLHDHPLYTGQWWACDHPERPHVDYVTIYDERCRACLIAMRAAIETGTFGPYVISVPDGEVRDPHEWLTDTWPTYWMEAS